MDITEKIKEIEEELGRTKHNKATEHHIGTLRARIAKLRDDQEKYTAKKQSESYSIKKEGDRTIILLGYPSVGKSTLINELTNTKSRVAHYEFTTLKPIPGIMEYNQTKIQVVDLPGIIKEASKGKGKGKQVLSAARSADLIIILLDSRKIETLSMIQTELYNAGIRLDQQPPRVIIKRKFKGGLNVETIKGLQVQKETIKVILKEYGIINADVIINEAVTIERLIDALSKNRYYIPSLVVVNKIDLKKVNMKDAVCISAEKKIGIEELKNGIWNRLNIIRIYLKKPGQQPALNTPVIIQKKTTIEELLKKLNFKKDIRYVQVWGKSARFNGQKLPRTHVLEDQDIISIY